MSHHELDTLQTALNTALNCLRNAMDGSKLSPLSQYAVDLHPLDSLDAPAPKDVYEARRAALAYIVNIQSLILLCCAGLHFQTELKHLLQHPFEKAAETTLSVYNFPTVQVFVDHGIADYMASAPSGISVDTLQLELNLDSRKITTILRHLSACGWVRETENGVFALNRSSRVLLQGHIGRSMIWRSESLKVADALPQWLIHPEYKFSQSPRHTAFQLANNTTKPFFEWVKDNNDYLGPFAASVEAVGKYATPGILSDYPWETCVGSTIVDCGGGSGSLAISLANRFPHLRLIVQEREEMVAIAETNIKACLNPSLAHGTVVVEAHDFFRPQLHTGDNHTFMLRHVLHNWPETQAVSILENIAAAAGPKSKILIIERISGYYPDTHVELENNQTDTSGVMPHASPIEEQTILNSSSLMPHVLALHLLCILNSHERTLDQWRDIIVRAGLVITGLYKLRAHVSILECRAAQT